MSAPLQDLQDTAGMCQGLTQDGNPLIAQAIEAEAQVPRLLLLPKAKASSRQLARLRAHCLSLQRSTGQLAVGSLSPLPLLPPPV